jgi:hypothetical protein
MESFKEGFGRKFLKARQTTSRKAEQAESKHLESADTSAFGIWNSAFE